jgi:hypothetical protein
MATTRKPSAPKKQQTKTAKRTAKAPEKKRAAAPPPNPEETESKGDKDAPVSAGETKRSKRPLARAAVAAIGLGIAVKRLLRKR